ncbi:MAG: hemerythrin family protein [Melioribacteraceae bacterium]|nr:hemerythrin family protein [Melioribacteraceae bacterium]
MSYIKWKSTYSIGIKVIDDQHKKLIEILNDLFEAHKLGTRKELITSALEKHTDYLLYHFKTEEDILRENNCPGLEEHIEEHNIFRSQISNFLSDTKKGNLLLSIKTIDYLKDWTINHILGTDKEYGEYLLEIELGKIF